MQDLSETGDATLTVTIGENPPDRLDKALAREVPEEAALSRTRLMKMIAEGDVLRDGTPVTDPKTRVSEGEEYTLILAPAEEYDARPEAIPLSILYEDADLIVIDKPAGVAVHGGSGVSFGVIEQLRQARPAAKFLELVHRLDKETSGVLLLAKKRSALTALQDVFRHRQAHKTYAALVLGAWPARTKVIDVALHKYLTAEGERRVKAVKGDDDEGRRSISLVKVVQTYAHFTLLDVTTEPPSITISTVLPASALPLLRQRLAGSRPGAGGCRPENARGTSRSAAAVKLRASATRTKTTRALRLSMGSVLAVHL